MTAFSLTEEREQIPISLARHVTQNKAGRTKAFKRRILFAKHFRRFCSRVAAAPFRLSFREPAARSTVTDRLLECH